MATYGFDMRGTSGYVTDPANCTYVLAETSAQTRNGITFNWTGGTGIAAADRSASADARLAGINYVGPGQTGTFNVTLPSSGLKDVRLALGDPHFSSWAGLQVIFKDNGSNLYTVGPATPATGNVIDANGNEYSVANWPANNTAKRLTFSTTVFSIQVSASPANYVTTCYLEIADVAAGPTAAEEIPAIYQAASGQMIGQMWAKHDDATTFDPRGFERRRHEDLDRARLSLRPGEAAARARTARRQDVPRTAWPLGGLGQADVHHPAHL